MIAPESPPSKRTKYKWIMSLGSGHIDKVRNTDLVSYLSRLGIEPEKIIADSYWYLSPLRDEKTPSFKVNRAINRWYDFGEGKGGNLIDFAIRYHQCTVAELLASFKADLLLLPSAPNTQVKTQSHKESRVKITDVTEIQKPALLKYLDQRLIDISVARLHCKQVHYQIQDKSFYAIGFANDAGGYELRNPYSKISSSPKDITRIVCGSGQLAVFEGFFDFLSYRSLSGLHASAKDFLVLNSAAFFNKAAPVLKSYVSVELYLDQDATGRALTQRALQQGSHYTDQSVLYKGYKDLNQYLTASKGPTQQHLGKSAGLNHSL